MTQTLARVRAHLSAHFSEAGLDAEPDAASVTFLGAEPIEVLRFRPPLRLSGVVHYVSLGCSRHPMTDPAADRRRSRAWPARRSRSAAT